MNLNNIQSIKHYGVTIYSKTNAYKFLEELKKHRIKLYGISGFYLHNDISIQPESKYDIDFGSKEFNFESFSVDEIYDLSQKLLNSAPDNIYFEFVYE